MLAWFLHKMKILLFIAVGVVFFGLVAYFGYHFIKPVKKIDPNEVKLFFNFEEQKPEETGCSSAPNIKYAYYSGSDPSWKINNKFGLYVYAEDKDFIEIATKLVNSSGGDWGYVLIPFNINDLDSPRWGRVFDQLIANHLIPVIQLWGLNIADYKKSTKDAAEFLNKFIWPIKFRYISVYNEPNDDKFWYGQADPAEYAKILDYTIKTFKDINKDFYMLNGGLNVSSPTNSENMDSFLFMKKMAEKVSGIFDKLDGWASHPYPQPNFAGSPYNTGRWSIRAYEDELAYLKNTLGVKKDLPVFITETGWAHAEGENWNGSYLPVEKVSDYFKKAYEEVWLKDDRVRAVMPFTIRYDPPFDHFSWINKDKVPYLHYVVVKDMKKVKGEPPALVTGNVKLQNCPQGQ